ncbi:unnamed protein product [Ilex paraguariensis]|uniref:Uncharacterized protein n=1 Tax=Ilex paraguariensis TaxID=185542 RepID=A0ABC8T3C6_9AQUA
MKLAQDIFMLENQIPLILLEEIQKAIQAEPTCANDKGKIPLLLSDYVKKWSVFDDAQVIYNFCKAHSPLKLMEFRLYGFEHKLVHLLDFMYHLIVNCRKPVVEPPPPIIMSASVDFLGNTQKILQISSSLGIGGPAVQAIQKHIQFVQALPWENIRSLFQKTDIDGNQSPVDEIEIPSVSSLQNIVGMKFSITEGGIRGIEFDEKTLTFHLPVITLDDNSEVILRNLVAYEALSMSVGSTLMLAEYVDLMCAIIDTAEDVKILQEQGIIVIKDGILRYLWL